MKTPKKDCKCTIGQMLLKIQTDFFLEHQSTPVDGWIENLREISICSKTYWYWKTQRKQRHKCSIFFKGKTGDAKIKSAISDASFDVDAEILIMQFPNRAFVVYFFSFFHSSLLFNLLAYCFFRQSNFFLLLLILRVLDI